MKFFIVDYNLHIFLLIYLCLIAIISLINKQLRIRQIKAIRTNNVPEELSCHASSETLDESVHLWTYYYLLRTPLKMHAVKILCTHSKRFMKRLL
jgi:hypothetical protein